MSEILLYVILGLLYLVFTALGKSSKKKQEQGKKEKPWSLEDALRDLQSGMEPQPEVVSMPPVDRASDLPEQRTRSAPVDAASPYKERPIERSIPAPPAIREPVAATPVKIQPHDSVPPTVQKDLSPKKRLSPIGVRLRDPKSAQTAVVLSEILRQPKGARGFPRAFPQR